MKKPKITIDLMYSDTEGNIKYVSGKAINAVSSAARKVLEKLGPLAEFITVFRVTFDHFGPIKNKENFGPVISVYFSDHLGTEYSFQSDYRFIGAGGYHPSASEIVDTLMEHLPKIIREHLKRAGVKIEHAQENLERALLESK